MALLHLEGFDKISTSTGSSSVTDVDNWLARNDYYWNTAKTVDYTVYAGWGGIGNAISLADGAAGSDNFLAKTITPHHTVITGFAFKPSADAEERDDEFLCFGSASENLDDHFVVKIAQGRHLQVFGDGSYTNQVKNVLFKDKWNYIELKIVFASSGSYELRVNGVSVLSQTGVTTSRSGSTNCDIVTLHGVHSSATSAGSFLYDDWYICDDQGSNNTTFLGPIKVETLMPSSAGDSAQFTPSAGANFENVDETPMDITTYNESGTSGHKDLFNIANLADITADIKGIVVTSYAISTEGSVMTYEGLIKTGITESNAGTFYVASDVYQPYHAVYETDPFTFSAWSVSNINSLQIGYEVS